MDTYIISSTFSRLQGVGLRYRLRKVAEENGIELEPKNLPDNKVQFTVKESTDIGPIKAFLQTFRPDAVISKKE